MDRLGSRSTLRSCAIKASAVIFEVQMTLKLMSIFQSLGMAIGIFIYLLMATKRVVAFVRHRRFLDLVGIIALKGIPFFLLFILIRKNSSVFELLWLTLGVTFGFSLFFIWFTRSWSRF